MSLKNCQAGIVTALIMLDPFRLVVGRVPEPSAFDRRRGSSTRTRWITLADLFRKLRLLSVAPVVST